MKSREVNVPFDQEFDKIFREFVDLLENNTDEKTLEEASSRVSEAYRHAFKPSR